MTTITDDLSGSVTLRRSREGVFWTLIVASNGNDLVSMRTAAEIARTLDDELRAAYPRRSRKTSTTASTDAPEGGTP